MCDHNCKYNHKNSCIEKHKHGFDCNDFVDLTIEKTGLENIIVENSVDYTVTVTNTSRINITNILIRDVYGSPTLMQIPIPMVSTGTIMNDILNVNSGSFNWFIPILAPNAIATLTLSLQPMEVGQIVNYAVIVNYNEIRRDINFINNESILFTNVLSS
jgi:hypothetical protein